MSQVMIPSEGTVDVSVEQDDPWDVHCWQLDDGSFQPHICVTTGVQLWRIASNSEVFDLQTTMAAKEVQGRVLMQVMSAKLESRSNRNEYPLFDPADEISRFAKELLQGKWDTTFIAINGKRTAAEVRMGQQQYQTASFTGSFSHVAVMEDESACVIFARWAASRSSGSQGDVYFMVRKSNPNQVSGFYTYDKKPQNRYDWAGRRR